VAHGLEDVGALGHPGPAAAMNEGVVGRFRRRKGVGLVQESADGYFGHQSGLGVRLTRRTLDSTLRRAQATNPVGFCMTRTTMSTTAAQVFQIGSTSCCNSRQSTVRRCEINEHKAVRSPWPRH